MNVSRLSVALFVVCIWSIDLESVNCKSTGHTYPCELLRNGDQPFLGTGSKSGKRCVHKGSKPSTSITPAASVSSASSKTLRGRTNSKGGQGSGKTAPLKNTKESGHFSTKRLVVNCPNTNTLGVGIGGGGQSAPKHTQKDGPIVYLGDGRCLVRQPYVDSYLNGDLAFESNIDADSKVSKQNDRRKSRKKRVAKENTGR